MLIECVWNCRKISRVIVFYRHYKILACMTTDHHRTRQVARKGGNSASSRRVCADVSNAQLTFRDIHFTLTPRLRLPPDGSPQAKSNKNKTKGATERTEWPKPNNPTLPKSVRLDYHERSRLRSCMN